jgi:16S rRNA processing protein RimM
VSDAKPALIALATIGAPFGVRGWVKIQSHIEPPERIFDYPVWSIARNERSDIHKVESSGRSAGMLTAKLAGVNDRDAAAALTGATVMVPRSELPAPAAREFYRADLIGFEVKTVDGRVLGTLQYFVETPAHALMMVGEGRQAQLVPAVPAHIRRVDLAARTVVVDWDEGAGA